MNQEQKLEIISTVYSDLDSIYSTPLKTKVAMVAQDTLNTIPVIKGIDITVLKAELDSCIKRLSDLESEVMLNKSRLFVLQKQLNTLAQESNDTVLGKVVILKDEE